MLKIISIIPARNGSKRIKDISNLFNDLFLKMIEIVMYFAPFGVFFLIYKTFLTQGFQAIVDLGAYFFSVLIVLIIHFYFYDLG